LVAPVETVEIRGLALSEKGDVVDYRPHTRRDSGDLEALARIPDAAEDTLNVGRRPRRLD